MHSFDSELLHVIPFFDDHFGGSVTASKSLISTLCHRGFAVRVWTTNLADLSGATTPNRTPDVDTATVERYAVRLKSAWKIARVAVTPGLIREAMLRDYSPLIVHLHDFRSVQAVSAFIFAQRRGIPLVLQPHGTLSRALEKINAKRLYDAIFGDALLQYASRIIVLSQGEEAACRQLGIPADRVARLHNGVHIPSEQDRLRSLRFRTTHDIDRDSFLVLYMGRIRESKGVMLLVEAFGLLNREFPKCVLVLCGPDDGLGASIRSAAELSGLRILMPGFVSGQEKSQAYADSDAFCLPSDFEVQPMSLLEAASFGLPIVAGRESAPPEFVESAAGLFPKLNAEGLAHSLLQLAVSPELRKELGERAQLVVEREFNPEIQVDRLVDIYRSITETRR